MSLSLKSGQIWRKETSPGEYLHVCLIRSCRPENGLYLKEQFWTCVIMEHAKENMVWIYPNIDELVTDDYLS